MITTKFPPRVFIRRHEALTWALTEKQVESDQEYLSLEEHDSIVAGLREENVRLIKNMIESLEKVKSGEWNIDAVLYSIQESLRGK